MMAPGWPATGWVWVEVGNRITRLPSGEICGGEPEPNPVGFVVSNVGDGGSTLWYGVADRSLIMRSVVPRVRGFTAGDPFSSSSSVVGVLLGPATLWCQGGG
jgi:hypothetical protein